MKEFIKKMILFLVILLIILGSYIFLIYIHPEFVDEVYYRFTTPKANSMIIGTSRSAVAIVPSVINEKLFNGEDKMINHSFTIGTSNYGPRYLREIKQKIQISDKKDEIFIIAVDPWALSIGSADVDDTNSFDESKRKVFVGGLSSSSVNPNYEYLKKYWGNRFNPLIILTKKLLNYRGTWLLDKDGWMNIDVDCDSATVKHRIELGIAEYKKIDVKLSETRFRSLEQIIEFLKNAGTVYLIRIPITKEMKAIEFQRFPEFDERINAISKKANVRYFDFINRNDCKFVDHNHMQKESAYLITGEICDSILSNKVVNLNKNPNL